jgi:hypothetical protein
MKSYNVKFNAIHPFPGRTIPNVNTRQVQRAALRRQAFADITKRYPGESRSGRRNMAFSKGNRQYRIEHPDTCPPHQVDTPTS